MTLNELHWILAIEDNPSDAKLLQIALDANPKPVALKCVKNGEDAIRLLSDLAQQGEDSLPDVILLDLNLPRVDGYEVLTQIRSDRAFRKIAVLVFTSSDSELERERAITEGADEFFSKPFDLPGYLNLPQTIEKTRESRARRLRRELGAPSSS